MTDDPMKVRARASLLQRIVDERQNKITRFLHSFYSAGSDEQILGCYGAALLDGFYNEIKLGEIAEWMAAFGSDARREGMEAALAKIASICQSAKNSDRLSTAEWHGFRVACEESDATIRAQIAEEARNGE